MADENNNNPKTDGTDADPPPKGNDSYYEKRWKLQDDARQQGVSLAQKFMTGCGAVLILGGGLSLGYGLWQVPTLQDRASRAVEIATSMESPFWGFAISNSEVLLYFIAGLILILLGTGLMRRAIAATAQTVSESDRFLLEPLIADGNEKAIGQYVRLASLSGVTGFFTKLGFTGLPLATAGLGVMLIFLAIYEDGDKSAQLMDLAKLVIGAFIGSFVQRKVASEGGNRPEENL